ncbi:ComEC family competence protein [Mycolicibacterium smegmatis]|uniref:ComEC/Rec2 family competence protein n=1 Tax=Mycolicibacterium smegmatis TaxID=1772 RepID=UPI0005D79E44|nr:ComEC/Rec2 family competence protein [Mycolicibacterium smegmatis]MDF1897379.1 ComEC/Rec2 family competence protein [Mycolicibacterium smegmatis]MDF1904178.1 ComEC/Rec2 family competence protein [Mycolicibacterium smegmatis]MDF1916945.1 ComEC/Rec2 family competence protein [Mycolicibacterium smegmatis]MDF1922319.1 ComEC/Rec2 family competence protein [Mycolicibacterium smegmatis]UAK56224.1 ComEC family competence protein [Mycolicibacterium smegmatis]
MTDEPELLDLRLVPAALTAWLVTAAGIVWYIAGSVLVVIVVTLLAAAVTRWAGPARTGAVVIAVAVTGVGFAVAIGLRVNQVREHPVVDRYGGAATVRVVVSEVPRPTRGNRLMFRAALTELDGAPVSGRVMVFASSRFGALTPGSPVGFRATLSRPTRADLTVAALSARGDPTIGEAPAIQRGAQRIRTSFAETARLVLPADQAAILPGLVLGDTSTVSTQTTAEFRSSGLTHLTAVSGANVTIVCGALLLSAALVGPRIAVGLALVGLVAFVIVVQPSASVLRSAVMGAVTLLAIVTHRRRQAIPALAASVLVLMAAAPELAVDVGFALSVCATAAIVVIAPVWARRLEARGWPSTLAAAVSVAAAAQLVTAPLVAGISGRFSVVAVAANLAVVGVIPPITVLGTAAAALAAVWPAGAGLLIRFTGPEVWWLLSVARWASGMPAATVPTPSGWAGVLLVAISGVTLTVLWRSRWVRRAVAGAAVVMLAWTVAGQVVGAVGPT